jgi:hypothetical protein
LKKPYPQKSPKKCPANVRLRVQYATDVVNDYFDRDKEPGNFILKLNGEQIKDFSVNLWNGSATLNVSLPENEKIGNIIKFHSEVSDDSKVDPLADDFYVHIIEPIKKYPGKPGNRKPAPSDNKGGDADKQENLSLPEIFEVREDEWDKFNFDRESALEVKDAGDEGFDFFVNMDNIYLLTEKKSNITISPSLMDARYKFGMVLIGLALLKADDNEKNSDSNDSNNNVYKKISYTTRTISPILLPMVAGLGDLREDEVAINYEEEEVTL